MTDSDYKVDIDKDTKAHVIEKLTIAKDDRSRNQAWLNSILDHTMTLNRRVGSDVGIQNPDDKELRFDNTLETTLDDFGTDMSHLFTPRYENWVKFAPKSELSDGEKKAYEDQIQALSTKLFSTIESSNFYTAAGKAYRFWGISVMAMEIAEGTALNAIDCQAINISNLLLAKGPNGSIDGRFREFGTIKKGEIKVIYPTIGYTCPKHKKNDKVKLVSGYVRDWSDPTIEAWHHVIMADTEVIHYQKFKGAGSCGIIVCPFEMDDETCWRPGPAYKALPTARTLDELAYLNLKAINKTLDPVVSYEEDGVTNPEGGIEPGDWISRAPGSKKPEPIESDVRHDVSFFQVNEMRKRLKEIMYQDRPDQAGKTPPTATQWVDEKAWNTRRLELARDLATQEWIMPIINRFAYIMAKNGDELVINTDKTTIEVKAVTPLSKARDLEDINNTSMMLDLATKIGAAVQTGAPINAAATIDKILKTAQERHIVLYTEEEQTKQKMMEVASQNAGQIIQSMGGQQDAATA